MVSFFTLHSCAGRLPISSTSANSIQLDQTIPGTLRVVAAGAWSLQDGLAADLKLDHHQPPIRQIILDAVGVTTWDSSLIEFLVRVERQSSSLHIATDHAALPAAMAQLLQLALSSPDQTGHATIPPRRKLLARLGLAVLGPWRDTLDLVGFLGEIVLGLGRLFTGRSSMRLMDLFTAFEAAGPLALPIVTLVSILVGLIVGFVGAVQLRRFGAEIYVANLVAIAMTREMGALMTAVIMSGRTAAAYAANLGTMRANDEISALQTTGLNPIDFLVVPRVIALVIAMPILTIFADFIGIFGGLTLGTLTLHLDWQLYLNQTIRSIGNADVFLGLIKAVFFGIILAIIGCWCGFRAERHAQGVGSATTKAVVLCTVLTICADAIFTVITTILGI